MGMSEPPRMPGHCWDRHPKYGIRCLEEPRHKGGHFNWATGDRWTKGGAIAKAAVQPRR